MKKLLVLITITCLGMTANAQYYLGIKAGGGISLIASGGTYAHFPGTNIYGGLEYKQNVAERVVLEGDLLFDMRSSLADDPAETLLSASYVSIPLTIHWTTPFRKKELSPYRTGQPNAFWYAEGGFAPMYALSQTNYIDPAAVAELTPADVAEFEAKPNPFDLALIGGLGVNFGFRNSLSRLVIGVRGSYGLLNYNNYPNNPVFKNIAYGGFLAWDFSLSQKRYFQYRW